MSKEQIMRERARLLHCIGACRKAAQRLNREFWERQEAKYWGLLAELPDPPMPREVLDSL